MSVLIALRREAHLEIVPQTREKNQGAKLMLTIEILIVTLTVMAKAA